MKILMKEAERKKKLQKRKCKSNMPDTAIVQLEFDIHKATMAIFHSQLFKYNKDMQGY